MLHKTTVLAAVLAAGFSVTGGAQAVSLVAVTTDNRLTTFDSATPSMLSPFVAITGVTAGARIVGIDTRPGDNRIYGVAPTTSFTPSTPSPAWPACIPP